MIKLQMFDSRYYMIEIVKVWLKLDFLFICANDSLEKIKILQGFSRDFQQI